MHAWNLCRGANRMFHVPNWVWPDLNSVSPPRNFSVPWILFTITNWIPNELQLCAGNPEFNVRSLELQKCCHWQILQCRICPLESSSVSTSGVNSVLVGRPQYHDLWGYPGIELWNFPTCPSQLCQLYNLQCQRLSAFLAVPDCTSRSGLNLRTPPP